MTRHHYMSPGVYCNGLARWIPSASHVDKPFVFNNRFKCVVGHEFWKDGEVVFPGRLRGVGEPYSVKYRTIYGYSFAHGGFIIEETNEELRLAMRRLTCKREPEVEGADDFLRARNMSFFNERIAEVIEILRTQFDSFLCQFDMREGAVELTIMPHPKRQLREDGWVFICLNGDVGRGCWVKSVNFKLKTDEVAKFGKYGRVVVDLGVTASLQGALWAEHVKKVLSQNAFRYRSCSCYFVGSPRPEDVTPYFDLLWEHGDVVCMICFSDDSCVSIFIDGVHYVFNVDISSCDASHTSAVFTTMFDAFLCPPEIREALTAQIMCPIRVYSVDERHKKDRDLVILKPTEYYLQSGITITTAINTFAQLFNFISIVDFINDSEAVDVAKLGECIICACRQVGYIVTVERCHIREETQFLKMSPMLDTNGVYRCVLNLGVVLRASGVCRGDLPGRGPLIPRAIDFQYSLMNGLLNCIDYPPIQKLKPNGGKLVPIDFSQYGSLYHTCVHDSRVWRSFTRGSFYTRYSLSEREIDELESYFENGCFGSVLYSSAVDKVLSKDYGLSPVAISVSPSVFRHTAT